MRNLQNGDVSVTSAERVQNIALQTFSMKPRVSSFLWSCNDFSLALKEVMTRFLIKTLNRGASLSLPKILADLLSISQLY